MNVNDTKCPRCGSPKLEKVPAIQEIAFLVADGEKCPVQTTYDRLCRKCGGQFPVYVD